jgi:Domain of unknown function (DUF5658)
VDIAESGADTVELVGHPVARVAAAAPQTVQERLRHVFSYRDTRALVVIFLATQVLDAGTTAYALHTGRFSEANPLLGSVVAAQPYVAYLAKLAIVFFVAISLLLLRLRWRMRRMVLTLFALVSLVAPVANILRITGHL